MYLYHINFSFRLNCLILNDNGIESIELGNKVQGLFQFYISLSYLLHFLLCLLLLRVVIKVSVNENFSTLFDFVFLGFLA